MVKAWSLLVFVAVVCARDLVVPTSSGQLKGKIDIFGVYAEFLGVPFAAPPLGSLRFMPPQPHKAWSGVRDATHFASDCMQEGSGGGLASVTSEDCLYLNVWTPVHDRKVKSNVPIMIFFYGGSWSYGGTRFDLYNGRRILQKHDNVVIITVNYRLGPLGALAGEFGLTGNQMLLDQRAAMAWIQKNAASFGGDAQRVTIWGESAGSASVGNHLVMPNSWQYFNRSIQESGPIAPWSARPLYVAKAMMVEAIMKETKCATLRCLQEYNVTQLMHISPRSAASHATNNTLFRYLKWGPTYGVPELPEHPETLMRKRVIAPGVKSVIGTNLNEGTLFVNGLDHKGTAAQYSQWLTSMFGAQVGSQVAKLYPVLSRKDGPWWTATDVIRDSIMLCPARRQAVFVGAQPGSSAHLYQFTHEWDEARVDPFLGVFHGSELPFVFRAHDGWIPLPDHVPIPIVLTHREDELVKNFQSYWNSFGTSADGVPVGPVSWPAYSNSTDQNIDLTLSIKVVSNLNKARCDFWDSINLLAIH